MSKRFRAAIYGGSGYGGGEMARRLLRHPEVELVRVAAIDHVGEPLSSAHPNLEGHTSLRFERLTPAEAARGVDIVLLGVPHRTSASFMQELLATGARVLDLSGDFRLRDAAVYERFYGVPHALPSRLDGTFVYGLPELNREAIRGARHVASAGCFATAMELALLPLARAGLLAGEVDVVGVTASSGSGVTPTPTTHHPSRAVNLRTYRPLVHQHQPEVEAALASAGAQGVSVRFVPVSAPLTRGILVTCFVRLPRGADRVEALYREAYAREPFVRVPRGRLPEVVAVAGSNHAEVGVQVEGDVVLCVAAIDNLLKGGAGQGIQSMNLMLGLDETLTLEGPGGYP
jgi:N-acetyl-gamma-glutamyl-phosphate reductase